MRKVIHSFEVHSNESACRKKVRLGLDQVIPQPTKTTQPTETPTASPPRVPSTIPMHTIRRSPRVPVSTVTPPASQNYTMTVTTTPSATTLDTHYGHDLLPFHHTNTVIQPTIGKEATIKYLISGNIPNQDGPKWSLSTCN